MEMEEAAAAAAAAAVDSSSDEIPEDNVESDEPSISSPEEYKIDDVDSSKCYSDDEWATLEDLQKV